MSSVYETEPVGFEDQPAFLNAVIEVKFQDHPKRLLQILKQIERDLGRNSDTAQPVLRWGPREIDLDLLLFGDEVFQDATLQIPHREMHNRRFVLVPLSELANDVPHPVLRKTIAELLQDLPDEKGVELFLQKDPISSRKIQARTKSSPEITPTIKGNPKNQLELRDSLKTQAAPQRNQEIVLN